LAKVDLTPVAGAEKLVLGEPTPLPLVVNLWATWCPPCRKELPDFQKVSDERKDAVRFVGVNVGEDEASASKFVESVGVTFDQYVDENSELQTALGVTGMPSTAFFAKDGTLVDVVSGAISRKDLETKIDTLFQEELVDE
jgi:thiol-disulfide isomerase/thioredoxin